MIKKITSAILMTLMAILSGCESPDGQILITDFEGFDPTLSEVAAHINHSLVQQGSIIRVAVADDLKDKKIEGRTKIGGGNLEIFCSAVTDVFACTSKERKNVITFCRENWSPL